MKKALMNQILKDRWVTYRERSRRKPSRNQKAVKEGTCWGNSIVSAEAQVDTEDVADVKNPKRQAETYTREAENTDAWKVLEQSQMKQSI